MKTQHSHKAVILKYLGQRKAVQPIYPFTLYCLYSFLQFGGSLGSRPQTLEGNLLGLHNLAKTSIQINRTLYASKHHNCFQKWHIMLMYETYHKES